MDFREVLMKIHNGYDDDDDECEWLCSVGLFSFSWVNEERKL